MTSDGLLTTFIVIILSLCGASILVLKKGFKNLSITHKILTVLVASLGFVGLSGVIFLYNKNVFNVTPIANAALLSESQIQQLDFISPLEKGPYKVKYLTYGSGTDLHRPEYATKVDFITNPVNGRFLNDQSGFRGWWRKKYWGFNSKSLPLNARVYFPEGEGPFPLVLIVHGDHSMQDYSDDGYGYLGELLASKGIIMASVDENFLNKSWSNFFKGLNKENHTRGWLLLEHLKTWHEWNKQKDHVFYKKIDTTNLALIGHSKGGEAVVYASVFNKLPFYPDDASIKFNYNYSIKSVVAIAPVDGQNKLGGSNPVLEDVNYLVLHGSHDGDVSSFMGSQQYERIVFNDSLYHFKSGVYIYGANHGQFNSSWGSNDTFNPFTGLLNQKQLISEEDQKKITKTYISSFLDITLNNKKEYLPLFIDARKGKNWLPKTIYLNQFEDSSFEAIANFDEDFNLQTVSKKGGKIETKNLSLWKEQEIQLKWRKKGSRSLFLEWKYNHKDKSKSIKSMPESLIASYTINIPPTPLDSTLSFVFSMSEYKENNNPNQKPIDFTILLSDTFGNEITFPLSKFSLLQKKIKAVIKKSEFIKGIKQSEMVFQTFYFPLKDFQKNNPNFDFSNTNKISFIFNINKTGSVAIDNIGFMKSLN
ncbi:hypothetical protein BWZ22_15135 [Seonamhaeicola sp. S2-3]|uniref:hypothetical protein n=1 Tax=Seonamhaeicola sp. S2-3 TaxID=1936081 RepID=UPI000972B1DF|nr:hypothetical protein [Seonamhaeicola sp. S2-3]APY12474.1 hypothetical protein BWZ22_15135 [Seonamhaeicola sp. S2-3]